MKGSSQRKSWTSPSTFALYARNFMHCLYIIVARNIYVPTRVKIRRLSKSTDRKSGQVVKNNVTIKLDDMSWKWYDLLLASNTIEIQDFWLIWTRGAPNRNWVVSLVNILYLERRLLRRCYKSTCYADGFCNHGEFDSWFL